MKIGLVIGAFSFGGAERVMCALANHLCKKHEVLMVTVVRAEMTYFIEENVRVINGINRKNDIDGVFKLRRVFVEEKPDVIISFITHINIATVLSTVGLNIPVIVSERNDPAKSATSPLRILLRRLVYPFAKGFVFQTEDARAFFKKNIRERSVVIPNPLFLEQESIAFEKRKNEIVSVGRLVEQKKQELIIEAFKNLHLDKYYTLTFYGNGEKKQFLQALIDSYGLSSRITLSEAVTDLHDRIKYAKMFVMMSEYEGMPNALMEAMGLGLVCISTDCPCGGPRTLIEDGVNGALVKVNALDELEEVMRKMLSDENLMKKIAQEALGVREKYSHQKIFDMWDAYIEKIFLGRNS